MLRNDDEGAADVTDHESDHPMNGNTLLLALLLSGFFAIACVRASAPEILQGESSVGASMRGMLRFPGRIERLRRSRWQWVALLALMIVLRLQQQLPIVLEIMAGLQFLLFLAAPARTSTHREEEKGALSR
jgi:hypothetical protein